eukprot:6713937-Alexandrium_andersonii.AAC.1
MGGAAGGPEDELGAHGPGTTAGACGQRRARPRTTCAAARLRGALQGGPEDELGAHGPGTPQG